MSKDNEDNSICYNGVNVSIFARYSYCRLWTPTFACSKARHFDGVEIKISGVSLKVKLMRGTYQLTTMYISDLHSSHVAFEFPATLTIFTKPSQYFVTFLRNVVTCWANSRVGTSISDLILLSVSCYRSARSVVSMASPKARHRKSHTSFAIKTLCTAGNPYAAVFPLPVLAFANTSFPCNIKGIA